MLKTETTLVQEGWITRFSRLMEGLVPDAITTSIGLLVILFAGALVIRNSLSMTLDAYYRGLWMLLPFTMQMTLIIVLSGVLGSTSVVRSMIVALSQVPKTVSQVVAGAVLLEAVLSYLYWGLGIAVGPIIAIHFAREAEKKNIPIDFQFLLAIVFAAGSAWQYGLSSSGPLLMATPGHFLEATTGIMPLSTTIWSPAAIAHEIVFILVVIVAGYLFMPKTRLPISDFSEAHRLSEPLEVLEERRGITFSERLERSPLIALVLVIALAAWLYLHFRVKHLGLDINSLNAILLLFCFLLHKNVNRFQKALQHAILSAWPVVVIYHLYAGVAGLIQFTTVGERLAGIIAGVSTPYTFPLLAAISGSVVAMFVPSSGGQWVIQGLVTSKVATAVGLTAQRGMLSLGVGDQFGNLVSPFWYVVTAGIARVDFKKFYGYGLVFAVLWFVVGTIIFTFLPC